MRNALTFAHIVPSKQMELFLDYQRIKQRKYGEYFRNLHCVKSVCIQSYSGPYSDIQSKCGKIQTRVTLNTDTFYTVLSLQTQ